MDYALLIKPVYFDSVLFQLIQIYYYSIILIEVFSEVHKKVKQIKNNNIKTQKEIL